MSHQATRLPAARPARRAFECSRMEPLPGGSMRILMLNHNAARQGTFLRCYHLARYLVPLGHSVTLLTTSPTQRGKTTRQEEAGVEIVETPSVLWGGPRAGFDPWT